MRAPTPVRSLVHSSTLVAAGVWFLLRYRSFLCCDTLWLLYVSRMSRVIIRGLCASCFEDLKKVVAFSTCKKIRWCILFFFRGGTGLAVCQLLTHGVCKCFLFMVVGDLMRSSNSAQDSKGLFSGRFQGGCAYFVRRFLVFCLCGLPFVGVFYSKHFFYFCRLYSFRLGYCFFLGAGLFLTSCYSSRLLGLLYSGGGGVSLSSLSLFFFVFFFCFLGLVLN